MAAKVRKLLRLYALAAKMDLAWLLRDTKFALLAIAADVLANVSIFGGIFLIALRFDGIGSMTADEILLMLGYATVVTGVFELFFNNNVGNVSRRIARGQIEHMQIMPVSFAMQLATEGFIPFTGSANLLCGIAVTVISLFRLQNPLPWWWVPAFVGSILCSVFLVFIYSYLFSSAAFYAPAATEEISSYVMDYTGYLSTFPLSGMPGWLQWGLLTILPSGLMAWFPTLVLLGKPPMGISGWFLPIFTVLLAVVTKWIFGKGLRHYVKVGANRYSAVGFRR